MYRDYTYSSHNPDQSMSRSAPFWPTFALALCVPVLATAGAFGFTYDAGGSPTNNGLFSYSLDGVAQNVSATAFEVPSDVDAWDIQTIEWSGRTHSDIGGVDHLNTPQDFEISFFEGLETIEFDPIGLCQNAHLPPQP
ncbi:MAG: hypothetical protein ACJAYU_001543 [Bradymonadia bacterium]|jgi:hypothetical protein